MRDEAPRMRALRMVPVAVLLLTASAAQAAVKLNFERKKVGDTGGPSTSTMTIDAQHIRMDGMGAGRGPRGAGSASTIIVDGPGKRFLVLEPEKKSYREITEADAKQLKERADAMKAQMNERMKNAPPEQRKRMEEMMGRRGGDQGFQTKYTPLGTKKKISGFACEMYKVEMAMGVTSEACVAAWSSNIVTQTELAEFKKLAAQLESTFAFGGSRMMSEWSKAPGVTVETTHLGPDGKPESTVTLKSITRGNVPASEFQPPADFTKDTTPMFGRGGGGFGGGRRGPGGPGGPGGATP
jgi:hypothetical protein